MLQLFVFFLAFYGFFVHFLDSKILDKIPETGGLAKLHNTVETHCTDPVRDTLHNKGAVIHKTSI